LLAIALRKINWAILEILSLVATNIVYWAWWDEYGLASSFIMTLLFVIAFWLLFLASDILHAWKGDKRYATLRHITGAANALFCFLALHDLLNHWYEDWTSVVTLMLGLVYFAASLGIRSEQEDKSAKLRYSLTAMALLVLATALEFSGYSTVMLWSLEAVLLVWCGLHWKVKPIWASSLGLLGLAVFAYIMLPTAFTFALEKDHQFTLLWNMRAAALLSLSAASVFCALLFRNLEEENSRTIQAILHSGWCALIFLFLTVETLDAFEAAKYAARDSGNSLTYLKNVQQLSLSGIWLLYSIVLMGFGLWRRQQGLRIFSIILFGITILKAFLFDLSFLETLYRIYSFFALGLILVAVSYLYQRYKAVIFVAKSE
jgi:hypothetical protein